MHSGLNGFDVNTSEAAPSGAPDRLRVPPGLGGASFMFATSLVNF